MDLPDVLTFREGPGIMARDFRSAGIPLIRVSGLKQGNSLLTGCNYLDPEAVEQRWSHFHLREGDVLLSTSASLGEVAVVDKTSAGAIPYTGIISFRPKGAEVIPAVIPYILRSPMFRVQTEAAGVGSVIRHFGPTHLKKMRLLLPPLTEQRAISDILGALDDKIAVNDRIAATTRQLGQTLFAELTQTDSRTLALSDVTEVITRGVTPKYSDSVDAVCVINQKCVRSGRVTLAPARRTLREKIKGPKLLRRFDVLVNSTGVGTLGRVAVWDRSGEATTDSHVTIVRFDASKIDPLCAGFAMLNAEAEIELLGEGSTGQTELSRKRLGELEIVVPVAETMGGLRRKLDALEARANAALDESTALAELRDTLLPRLMSGEVRIQDAERAVEEAT